MPPSSLSRSAVFVAVRAQGVLLDCVQNGGSFSLLPARLSVNHPTLTVHMKAATVTSLQQCFDIDFRHQKVIYRGHGLSPKKPTRGKQFLAQRWEDREPCSSPRSSR